MQLWPHFNFVYPITVSKIGPVGDISQTKSTAWMKTISDDFKATSQKAFYNAENTLKISP